MSNALVDIRGVSVLRHHRQVLQDITLRVEPGEFVGIIGPNGAGKTTLLMLINGMIRAAGGNVETLGVRLPIRSAYRLRRRIGYVAQVENVDPRLPMTVNETVLLGAAGRLGWFRKPEEALRRKVVEAMEQTGILRMADRPIGQLSGGEYQRTAIARVLVQQPDLFLFDEPTASIDPRAQKEILRIIQEMHFESGATALYVTHDLHTLPEQCTRLVLMKGGRIWREGSREAMLEPDLLEALYDTSDSDSADSAWGA